MGDDALVVLEAFVHQSDPDISYRELCEAWKMPVDIEAMGTILSSAACGQNDVLLGVSKVLVRDARPTRLSNLTAASRTYRRVVASLMRARRGEHIPHQLPTRARFDEEMAALYEAGLMVPAPGHVEWGDLRRTNPCCRAFGFSRGTPVDRYYLAQCVAAIGYRVAGSVVEIGGRAGNIEKYGFSRVTSYANTDLSASPDVQIVGDAHDPALLAATSIDAIIALNVLEHCLRPWTVVENMHRWLRPGGTAFCMVPNAQRVHRAPMDYWRPMPDGLASLFHAFASRELFQYGNPTSLIASYMGIAAEELTTAELDAYNADYPVAVCIVATK
jgi:SAM-dependent methyltransferase